MKAQINMLFLLVSFSPLIAVADPYSLFDGTFAAPTLTDHTAVYEPAKGAIVFDTSDNKFYGNVGTPSTPSWQQFGAASGTVYAWSGYHESGCDFSRTSNVTFGDFAADTVCTFTQAQNSNFGTVTSYVSGSDKLPGIVFTPPVVGLYYVAVSTVVCNGDAADHAMVRLTDGTTVIANPTNRNADGSSVNVCFPTVLQGIYNVSSVSSKTIRIEGTTNTSATLSLSATGGYGRTVEWTVFKLN